MRVSSLRGRWVAWRNRVLASERFQRVAVRFPLTRPVAHAHARALFDLVAGFTYSQILAACIETGLLDQLAAGPLHVATIAERTGLPVAGAERLLLGAAALGLVERLADAWVLGVRGAALRGNRGIADMIAHHHMLYADLADPVALLRRGGGGGALSRYWHYAAGTGGGDGDAVAGYSALMARSQPLIAAHVLASYSFHHHRKLLDVGGGEGEFLRAVAAQVPELGLGLFDLPSVIQRARTRFEAAGLSAATHQGDFLAGPLPTGYDLISLVRVLHDHDDAPAMVLLRNIHAALPPGGALLIAEPMAGTRGAESAGDAYFGFYLLAMGSGRPRTTQEISSMLRRAGFSITRVLQTGMPLTVQAIIAAR